MNISNELFLSILAMDAYNRGYDSGIQSPGATRDQGLTGGQLGTAIVGNASSSLENSAARNASFYAQSYT